MTLPDWIARPMVAYGALTRTANRGQIEDPCSGFCRVSKTMGPLPPLPPGPVRPLCDSAPYRHTLSAPEQAENAAINRVL